MAQKIDTQLIHNLAVLSRLHIDTSDIANYSEKINNIIQMLDLINKTDTQDCKPMAHPMDLAQPLRADCVTEDNQVNKLQSIAPKTKSNLYLTPKTLDQT